MVQISQQSVVMVDQDSKIAWMACALRAIARNTAFQELDAPMTTQLSLWAVAGLIPAETSADRHSPRNIRTQPTQSTVAARHSARPPQAAGLLQNRRPTLHAGVDAPPVVEAVVSPNDGETTARQALYDRFADRLSFDPEFTRKTVSYQGNREAPGLRWMKYKEGFSRTLVNYLLDKYEPEQILDPFAGIGTTVLTAAGRGLQATGIEIMPVGILAGNAIAEAATDVLSTTVIDDAARAIRERLESETSPAAKYAFPHVKITQAAFPAATEKALGKAREFVAEMDDVAPKTLVNLACMSVLEAVSYTRKDGQYLRWDTRSGRKLRARMDKGPIPTFSAALIKRLSEIANDLDRIKQLYGRGRPVFLAGSSLELLKGLPDAAFDMVITSPPYANRYDYTRTYALELAWLGLDQGGFARLRQQMLSATVENRTKIDLLRELYRERPETIHHAIAAYERQVALHEVLHILRTHTDELGNPHVIRLLEGYFLEMAVIVAELGRLVRRGGSVIMVNDNVQYHGEEVPVDIILSDLAEQSGFTCTDIWTLARGKGNASQQMGRFGRREIRKCVYRWERQ